MKRLFVILTAFVCTLASFAQSAYISHSPSSEEDRIGDLNGDGGVLIISKRNDLVITVVNAANARVSAATSRSDGRYEYEVVVPRSITKEPKIEINRRGDIDRESWVVITKPDYFFAFTVEETQKPIRMENQTAANDAILDETLAQVEFQTTIDDLTVDCKELEKLGAKVEKRQKKGDNSIHITTVTIPIKILDNVRRNVETSQAAYEKLFNQLDKEAASGRDVPQSQWEQLDELKEKWQNAEEMLQKTTRMDVYATGTNHLPVDISSLGPRSKMVYGVLVRTIIQKEHVSACAGFMEEGGRLFGLRKYADARRAFQNALSANDTPNDFKNSISTSIAQCDSCAAYEKYTLNAFAKIRELKNLGGGSQEDLVKYASAAIEYLKELNKYNPSEFYTDRQAQLEKLIEDLPLEIMFTLVRWVNNEAGFYEAGKIPNVEIWAFKGKEPPTLNSYRSDKKFKEMVGKSNNFVQLSTTDSEGKADVRLDRKALPTGFFFRPTGYGDKIKIEYKDAKEMLRQSQGTYNKRRFRQKMFAAY